MGFLSRLFGGSKDERRPKKRPVSRVQSQYRQLQKQMMTPDREALIAQAMAVRRAKQTIFKGLGEDDGAERVTNALRRVMERQR